MKGCFACKLSLAQVSFMGCDLRADLEELLMSKLPEQELCLSAPKPDPNEDTVQTRKICPPCKNIFIKKICSACARARCTKISWTLHTALRPPSCNNQVARLQHAHTQLESALWLALAQNLALLTISK